MSRRISPLVPSLLLLFLLVFQFTDATTSDTFRPGQSLRTRDIISSANRSFNLGFSYMGNSENLYVVIAANTPDDIVWIANREQPFVSSSTVLTFSSDGNLVVSDGRLSYKLTNISAGNDTYATLYDTGNLVLKNRAEEVLWQSFDYPTYLLLPGMKIGDAKTGRSLESLKSYDDPAPGPFSLILGPQKQLVLMEGTKQYWSSLLVGRVADIFVVDGEYVTMNASYTDGQIYLDTYGNLPLLTWNQGERNWNVEYLYKCAGNGCDVSGTNSVGVTLEVPKFRIPKLAKRPSKWIYVTLAALGVPAAWFTKTCFNKKRSNNGENIDGE